MTVEYTGVGSVHKKYGPYSTAEAGAFGTRESIRGDIHQLEYVFDFNGLPAWSATNLNDANIPVLPALAAITKARLSIITAFVGGTSLEVGTFQAVAGTAVDADGLIPAAAAATAVLLAGSVIEGRGVQVLESPDAAGTAHNGGAGLYPAAATGPVCTVASVIGVVAVGTFTAGRAKLVVEYIRNDA